MLGGTNPQVPRRGQTPSLRDKERQTREAVNEIMRDAEAELASPGMKEPR